MKRFCIVTYFKKRALKQIIQWLIIAAVTVFMLGAFAVADAYAQGLRCAELSGATTPILPIVGDDAGEMDFDLDPPTGDLSAEICATRGTTDFELRGWVWDNNLGYISLYCDERGRNNGVRCGPIEYGVKVDLDGGRMYGWAWGDNIGWISFFCKGGFNDGSSCGTTGYSSDAEIKVGTDLGTLSGWAWADSVGWFNMTGVTSQILDLVMAQSTTETGWGVWTKGEIEDNGLTNAERDGVPLKSTMPVADSTDGYDIFVHVADINGNPVQTDAEVTVDIETTWNDSVNYNQIDATAVDWNTANGGPVIKPSVQTSLGKELIFSAAESTTGGVANSYHGVVTSQAPTDGGNCYDGDGDGSCFGGEGDFFYKDFGDSLPSNNLTYLSAVVTVTINMTSETWTTALTPLGYPGGRSMEFLPTVDIPVFDYLYQGNPIPVIQALRNQVDEFDISGALNGVPGGSYEIALELLENEPDVDYVFIDTLEQDPVTAISTKKVTNVASLGATLALPFAPDSQLAEFLTGAEVHSIVTINPLVGSPTVYYNNGLPRVSTSEIQTQQAQIVSGSVFSPGAIDVVQGVDVPLFGDVAVYELRTQILEDVSELIRGTQITGTGGQITINDMTPQTTIDNHKLKGGRLYYFKNEDVYISSMDKFTSAAPGESVTIVVQDGDLFIRQDVDAGVPVGFIVFESITDASQETKGGRMYVHSDVTDMVDVHIFADGPVFRYNDAVCYYWGNYGPGNSLEGLREPNFVDPTRCSGPGSFQDPRIANPNQFYLKGNAASFNCLGCSNALQPSRGDGKIIGSANALNFAIARLFDFNSFTYYLEDPLNPGVFSGNPSTSVAAHPTITDKNQSTYFEYAPAQNVLGFRDF